MVSIQSEKEEDFVEEGTTFFWKPTTLVWLLLSKLLEWKSKKKLMFFYDQSICNRANQQYRLRNGKCRSRNSCKRFQQGVPDAFIRDVTIDF